MTAFQRNSRNRRRVLRWLTLLRRLLESYEPPFDRWGSACALRPPRARGEALLSSPPNDKEGEPAETDVERFGRLRGGVEGV
jgi:hypothetical protein